MARRILTSILLVFGLLSFNKSKAQPVTFSFSPSTVTTAPAIGDTIKLQVVVKNFTNVLSIQYKINWDASLMSYAGAVKNGTNMPDTARLGFGLDGGNNILASWSSANGLGKNVGDNLTIFTVNFKVLANSSNYWARFTGTPDFEVEIIKDPNTRVTPSFGNFGNPPGNGVGIITESKTVATNQKVCVGVTSSDFTNIESAGFTLNWDKAVLRYDSVSTLSPKLALTMNDFGTSETSTNGRLFFAWVNVASPKTLLNTDTLFKVCYTSVGAGGTSSLVNTTAPEIYRSQSGSSVLMAVTPQNGTVNISNIVNPPSTGTELYASNEVGAVGETVCVKVYTKIKTISTISFSMRWDSSKVEFVKAVLTALQPDSVVAPATVSPNALFNSAPLSGTNPPSGTLRFAWASNSGDPVTSTQDSTLLMTVCFKILSGNSAFSFVNTPTLRIKVTGLVEPELQNIVPVITNGSISVGTAACAITATKTITNVNCFGQATGGVNIVPAGGTGPYTYLWSSSETTANISNKAAGQYIVAITDSKSCTLRDTTVITQPTAALSATPTPVKVKCKDGSTGSVTLNVVGGTPNYTYSWTGPNSFTAATKDIASLKAGNYFVTVTDSKGCAQTLGPIVVTEPAAISQTNVVTNAACAQNNGTIVLTPAGGTSPYTYSWTGPNGFINTNKDITNLATGNYIVTITDTEGCTFTSPAINVGTSNSTITATGSTTNVSCNNGSNGAINLTVTGATGNPTYIWSGPNSFTATTKDITNLRAGSYTVTITDAQNCSTIPSPFVIGQPTAMAITEQVTNVLCKDASTGSITLTVSGGTGTTYTYNWSGPNTFTATSKDITGVKAGTYNVTATDANTCTVNKPIVITEPAAALTIGTPSVTATSCTATNGAIAVSPSGGTPQYTYSWTGPNGFTSTAQNLSNLASGTYSLTVTDANNCTQTTTINVQQGTTNLALGTPAITNVLCNGGTTGAISISVTGGTPQYTYAWSGPASFTSSAASITGRTAGTYTLTVTDASGCQVSNTNIVITQPTAMVVDGVVRDAVFDCNGSITLTVSGGTGTYTYNWAGDGVNTTAKDQVNLCPPKNYSVTITDGNGCTATRQYLISGSPARPIVLLDSTITNAGCPGQNTGAIRVNFSGGKSPFAFEWKNANGNIIGREQNIDRLPSGKYTLKISDAVGQSYLTSVFDVKQSESAINIAIRTITSESCSGNDGKIDLDVTGGASPYTFTWNVPGTTSTLSNLREGTYSVIVKDLNQCVSEKKDIVVGKIPCPLSANVTNKNDVKCFNTNTGSITINIQNGEPGYVIRWSETDSVRVNNAPSKTGSYEIKNLRAGLYTILVRDAKNQIQTFQETINQPTSEITIEKSITADTGSCSGNIVLTVSGGTPLYNFRWNDGVTARDRFQLCTNQILSVTVTDANGCFKSSGNDTIPRGGIIPNACASVKINTVFDGNVNLKCFGDRNASATVTGINDRTIAAPFSYRWDNGESGPTAIALPGGARTVNVSGSNGKSCTASILIKSPDELKVVIIPKTLGECSLEAKPTGGVSPYKYQWTTPTGDTTIKVINLKAKTRYIALVTDKNGCVTQGVEVANCNNEEYCLEGSPVLSPNDDGRNDKFLIEKCDFPKVQVQIYNRWGQLVYENPDYTDQWEGNIGDGKNSTNLPDGVYFYVLKGTAANGKEETKKGTVTILR
jgi:gliding motility-associated-like protein